MPFKSEKQRKWYYANDQHFYDDYEKKGKYKSKDVSSNQMIGSRTSFYFNPIKSGRVYSIPKDININDLIKDAEEFNIKVRLSPEKKQIVFQLPFEMLRKF